ncbi:hypothetical protein POM88_032955 [Heracleum sosnowskyi]|uniref:Uncharacterized protein n=1 Tax=Heracleum sosnowskyi TaxID=360622 RepID=A0AAD8I0A9_9APIA|nr:hypothetical protein POM88_032955 [Heracleum sosnowskyi]
MLLGGDRKDVFFHQADDQHYISRALLMDLESRVINGIQTGDYSNLFNYEIFIYVKRGRGAGNNCASGYHQTKNVMVSPARTKESSQAKCISILNIIQGEVDPAPSDHLPRILTELHSPYYCEIRFMIVSKESVKESLLISLNEDLQAFRLVYPENPLMFKLPIG